MKLGSDATGALHKLVSLRTNQLVDAALRDRLEYLRHQRENQGYDDGSPAWLPLYHEALAIADELLNALKTQEQESRDAANAEEDTGQRAQRIDTLLWTLKRFADQFQMAVSEVSIHVTQAEYDAIAQVDQLLQGVKVATSLKQGFMTVFVPDDEKRRVTLQANKVIRLCIASAAQSLDRFFRTEARNTMSIISRDCLQLQIPGAKRLQSAFRHHDKQLNISENQQSFEVPSLWKLSLLSGRQVVFSISMLAMIGASMLPFVYGKGETSYNRLVFTAPLLMIALPAFVVFIFTSLRRRRDRQVRDNTDRAKKRLIGEYAKAIKTHLSICRESFKGNLNLFQNKYSGAIKNLKESAERLRARRSFGDGATRVAQTKATSASRQQLIEKLQSEIIPHIQTRIREEPKMVTPKPALKPAVRWPATSGLPGIQLSLWISDNAGGAELAADETQDGDKEYLLHQSDEIHLNIETNRIVHLFIVNFDQDENCQVVFPNGYYRKDTIMAFERHVIPGKKHPFRWRVLGTGSNHIMAFASTKDVWPTEPRQVDSFLQLDAEKSRKLLEKLRRRMAELANHEVTQTTIYYRVID